MLVHARDLEAQSPASGWSAQYGDWRNSFPMLPIVAALFGLLLPLSPRHAPVVAKDGAADSHARLTLVRHGQSEWNLANRVRE